MAAEQLVQGKCTPCEGGVEPLKGDKLREIMSDISAEWQLVNDHHLHREFEFDDFRGALDFVNRVGQLAEEQNHHPDMCLSWGKAEVTLWSHKIDGLHRNDFILAAKIDELYS